jgi:hypothetical protein
MTSFARRRGPSRCADFAFPEMAPSDTRGDRERSGSSPEVRPPDGPITAPAAAAGRDRDRAHRVSSSSCATSPAPRGKRATVLTKRRSPPSARRIPLQLGYSDESPSFTARPCSPPTTATASTARGEGLIGLDQATVYPLRRRTSSLIVTPRWLGTDGPARPSAVGDRVDPTFKPSRRGRRLTVIRTGVPAIISVDGVHPRELRMSVRTPAANDLVEPRARGLGDRLDVLETCSVWDSTSSPASFPVDGPARRRK